MTESSDIRICAYLRLWPGILIVHALLHCHNLYLLLLLFGSLYGTCLKGKCKGISASRMVQVLIFSQFKIMLNVLEDYLRLKKFPLERIDGSVSQRDREIAINRYSAGMGHIFVYSLCMVLDPQISAECLEAVWSERMGCSLWVLTEAFTPVHLSDASRQLFWAHQRVVQQGKLESLPLDVGLQGERCQPACDKTM